VNRTLGLALATAIALVSSRALAVEPPAPAPEPAEESVSPFALETIGPAPIDRKDPLESLNRRIYRFNAIFDKWVFLPALRTYRMMVPSPLRRGFSNFLSNLDQITSLTNSILQLDAKKTAGTLGRLVVNSTLGCAGVADPASHLGLIDYNEDFGQTLGHWGVGPGAYLVLPMAGPSSVRDGIGFGLDVAFRSYLQSQIVDVSPFDPPYMAWATGQALQARDDQPFRYGEAGPFEYDLVRYFYLEHRRAEIAF
jgi:phospholipid-binding lipoprotein MlaA